jgi:biotin transport system substrate-specific component
MSNLSLAIGRPTIADRVLPRSLATDLVLVAAGAALVAIAAQFYVPMWPVPISGQTFAVLLVGTTLGASRGALSMALYAVLGLIGLPVYTDGAASLAYFGGTTGGYIVGFVFAAAVSGWLAQRAWDRRVLGTLATFAAGTVTIYAFGLPWLAIVLSKMGVPDVLGSTINGGLLPFLVGDALKALLAAGLLPLAWKAIGRSDRRSLSAE